MSNPTWDPEDPLAPAENETAKCNAALRDYALLGHVRSLKMLGRKYENDEKKRQRGNKSVAPPPTTSQATINYWSARWDWVNRVLVWEMLKKDEEEAVWAGRREKVREDDWSHAKALRDLAQRIIDAAPAFIKSSRKVVDDGTPRVVDLDGNIIKPGRPREIVVTVELSITDLVRVEKLASRLARLSAEMDESYRHITVDWRQEAKNAGIDPTEFFEKLVRQVTADQHRGDKPTGGGGSEGSTTQTVD